MSLIILWAAFGDPVLVFFKIWYQKRRGDFERKAFGRSRSTVRRTSVVPRKRKPRKGSASTTSDDDSSEDEHEGDEGDRGDEEDEGDDEVRRSSLQVKKEFERDAERKELEAGIAKSRQKEHTQKRLEERRALKLEQDKESEKSNRGDSAVGGETKSDKKLSKLEKRRKFKGAFCLPFLLFAVSSTQMFLILFLQV